MLLFLAKAYAQTAILFHSEWLLQSFLCWMSQKMWGLPGHRGQMQCSLWEHWSYTDQECSEWVPTLTRSEFDPLLISPRGTFPCSSKAGSAHRHFWHWDTSAIDPCCSKTPNSCFLCWRNFCFAVQTPEICDQATVRLGGVSVCKPHLKKRWGLLPSGFTLFLLPLRYKHPGNTS